MVDSGRLPVPLSMLRSPSTPQSILRFFLRFWPLLLPLLLFLPWMSGFPYPSSGASFSDLAISHYPNSIYLKKALLDLRELPFWSPSILSGFPFAANPLAGLWYPPGWLALLLPLPLGFNLLVALHLLWGGAGMYRLLRNEGLVYGAALFGALSFEALPKLFAHFGAGHLTLLYAVSWTPWLLLADRKAYQVPRTASRLVQPGLVLSLIFLADVRWAAFAGVLWLAYSCSRRISFRHMGHLARQLALTALLSTPLALPLLEFARLATRTQMAAGDVFTFSLPPARLLGLLFPDFGGFHEWILYPGAAVLLLGLLALFWGAVRRRSRFWLWVAGLSLLYSLGSGIPLFTYLARLPGLDLLRVPSRALFLTGMAFAAAAAYSLDHLLKGLADGERHRARLLFTGLATFALVLPAAVWGATRGLPLSFAWGAGTVLAAALWIGLGLRARFKQGLWLAVLFGLFLLDAGMVDRSLFTMRSADLVEAEGSAAASYLASIPGRFRIYSPSYSLPQQTAARYGLELADGVDPMQLRSYVSFMQAATGVPWNGYSVTLPPFANGDPAHDNATYRPDPALLGLLNVRYVAADFDLAVNGLELRQRFGQTRIYENLKVLPRAWVQPLSNALGEDASPVELTSWRPNRVVVKVDGSAGPVDDQRLLVLSELAYPGWQVMVDGKQAAVQLAGGILRAVEISPGSHQVVFVFRPLSVYLGLALFLLGLVLLVFVPQLFRVQPRNPS